MSTPVTSVQRGSRLITAVDGTTIDITISAVTVANCIVEYTFSGNDNAGRLKRHVFRAWLTSTTNLRFTRFEAVTLVDIQVEYAVTEFTSPVSYQTGTSSVTADPTDISISAVTLANAFVITSFETNTIGAFDAMRAGSAYLTSTTNLRIDPTGAPGAGEYEIRYQVMELSTITVQSGLNTFGSSDFQDTPAISAVNLSEALVLSAGQSTAYFPPNRNGVRWGFNSTTQLVGDRANPGSDFGAAGAYQVIEFTGNAVTRGNSQIANGNTSVNPTFAAVSANSMVMNFQPQQNWLGDSVDVSDTLGSILHSIKLDVGLNGVTITRAGTSRNLNVGWAVVDFAGGSPPAGYAFTQGAIIGA